MVIDNKTTYIGTFNLDPRSINLNTEVGVIIRDKNIASQVEQAINRDMSELNSWKLRDVNTNSMASWPKRIKLFFYKLLPMEPVL
jgi:putative cardiolipin synthase